MRIFPRPCLAIPFLAAVSCAQGQPRAKPEIGMAYYRNIKIDTTTLKVELTDPYSDWPYPPKKPHYSPGGNNMGMTINHYSGTRHRDFPVRYNAIMIDPERKLTNRSKKQELLHGPYGTVYADTMYRYSDPLVGEYRGSSFFVALYGNRTEHEPPEVIAKLPQPLPVLCAISVVRVFEADPGYMVVTATYGGNGDYKASSTEWSKDGEWVHSSTISELAKQKSAFGAHPERLIQKAGLRKKIQVEAYLKQPQPVWEKTDLVNTLNVVNFHYDYNRFVQQDSFDKDGKLTTRFLKYVVTEADKILEALDRSQPLGVVKQVTDKTKEKK